MTYSVIVEKDQGNYLARAVGWPDCVARGGSRNDVLAQMKAMLGRLLSGAEVVELEVEPSRPSHPILEFAGVFKDDPFFDEVQAEIEAYRQEIDEDEGVP